jgi:Fur family transcriptional regulator, ferric uptake regulator
VESSREGVEAALRARGLRLTAQRRAIVAEVLAARGHISPTSVYERVRAQLPGVNPSTIYRTLEALEETGVLTHTHISSGAEYHRTAEGDHVHLECRRCGGEEVLSADEARPIEAVIRRARGFEADLTHSAIWGLCAQCRSLGEGASGSD